MAAVVPVLLKNESPERGIKLGEPRTMSVYARRYFEYVVYTLWGTLRRITNIEVVDLTAKTLCGFIKVDKASKDTESFENPNDGKSTASFFIGEIISRKFPFVTGKWGATIETDTNHWNELNVMARFPNYYRDSFDYSQLEKFDHVYMRWKEGFILPDSTKNSEKKPSSGFYYICLQKSTGELTGYFYNKSSERLQLLELKYDPQVTSTAFQIR